MICGFVGFDFEGMMRVSYAEAASNSVTFPSFNNASPLCAESPSTNVLFTEATLLGEASSRPMR